MSLVMLVALTIAATSLFGYASSRVMNETANAGVLNQASTLADELAEAISQSNNCTLISSGTVTALVCQMPGTGTDKDGDGVVEVSSPTDVTRTGNETYPTARYVWFYFSNSTGTWGTAGTWFWRAKPTTSAAPASADLDSGWSTYYGGKSRWNLIDSVTFSNDATNHLTTITITASTLNRAERSAVGETSNSSTSKIVLTRTAFWRSYR